MRALACRQGPDADAICVVRASLVRYVSRDRHGERFTGADEENAADLPPAEDRICDGMHVRAVRAAAAEREVVDEACDPIMAKIVLRIATVERDVVVYRGNFRRRRSTCRLHHRWRATKCTKARNVRPPENRFSAFAVNAL